jgi:hypothetical protein
MGMQQERDVENVALQMLKVQWSALWICSNVNEGFTGRERMKGENCILSIPPFRGGTLHSPNSPLLPSRISPPPFFLHHHTHSSLFSSPPLHPLLSLCDVQALDVSDSVCCDLTAGRLSTEAEKNKGVLGRT